MQNEAAKAPGVADRRPRDPRLDFFRGLAMFIILIAHIPDNPWTLWIPARFGFSDATEIFVFCSGMASAYAFGSVFATRGLFLGTMRVAYRVWQVYWAHVGVFLVSSALLVAIDLNEWGAGGLDYVTRPYVVPFFEQTGETLIGLLTLSYVPGLFDILPMYLLILAMIPLVMLAHGQGGPGAAAALVLVLWALASLAGHPRVTAGTAPWLGEGGMALAARLSFLNLTALPGGDAVWFFNPFAWQLIFFTGFGFGMGWLPTPPVSRSLVWVAAGVLLLSLPVAWFRLYQPVYLPEGSALQAALAAGRDAIAPLTTKTWFGAFRYLHFLALAYLAWVAVGPRGVRMSQSIPRRSVSVPVRSLVVTVSLPIAALTAPYAHVDAIARHWPALDAWLRAHWWIIPDGRIGLMHLAHFAAVVALLWQATPERARQWLCEPGWAHAVRIVRKVGTQSLAVFMTSIPLALFCGLALDWIGRSRFPVALVNLAGFAILIVTAYFSAWIKGHPWRRPVPHQQMALRRAPAPAE
jgi:hypothetical protein